MTDVRYRTIGAQLILACDAIHDLCTANDATSGALRRKIVELESERDMLLQRPELLEKDHKAEIKREMEEAADKERNQLRQSLEDLQRQVNAKDKQYVSRS